jgi:hypothetical protein
VGNSKDPVTMMKANTKPAVIVHAVLTVVGVVHPVT